MNLSADQIREGAAHRFFQVDRDGTYAEYANLAAFPAAGVPNRLYMALDTSQLYRWNGTAYVANAGGGGGGGGATNLTTSVAPTTVTINSDTGTDAVVPAADGTNAGAMTSAMQLKLAGVATGATAYTNVDADARVAAAVATGTGSLVRATSPALVTPTGIVKGDVGLGSVDNTADTAKPVSTAQQSALDSKANANNAVLTGTVTIPDGALAIADTAGLQAALDVGASWPKVWAGQNYWYELPAAGGNNSTQATTLSRAYALPVLVPIGCTLSDVLVEVTTVGAAGAVLRAGLYDATTAGLPGALISEAAATAVATTLGMKTFTFTPNRVLAADTLYFVVIASQVALCTVRVRVSNDPLVVTTVTPTGFTNYTSYYVTMAGAMPATFGAPTGTIQGPCAYLRLT